MIRTRCRNHRILAACLAAAVTGAMATRAHDGTVETVAAEDSRPPMPTVDPSAAAATNVSADARARFVDAMNESQQRGSVSSEDSEILAALCWAAKESLEEELPIRWQEQWADDGRFERFAALHFCQVLPQQVTAAHLRGVWLDVYGVPSTSDEWTRAATLWRSFRSQHRSRP